MLDVFCLVKQTMSCRELSQNPLLVWPAGLVQHSQKVWDDCNDPGCPTITCTLSSDRIEELKLIREAIQRDFPHMRRTLAWYDGMIRANTPPQRPLPLSFVRYRNAHDMDVMNVQLGQRPVPPKPHELEVVFHRGRF